MQMQSESELQKQWRAEFEAAAKRTLPQRMRYAFIHKSKPVLDDARFRSFNTMVEYRQQDVEGFPVCSIDDIISSKQAANRVKDKESLPRLLSFRDWLMGRK